MLETLILYHRAIMRLPKISKADLEHQIHTYANIYLIVQNTGISINTIRAYIKKYQITTPSGFYKQLHPRKKRKPLSEEHKKAMSIRFSGKNNPFYGKKHTKETKQKMSENHADFTGENNPFKNACINNPELLHQASQNKIKEWSKLSPIERYKRNKKTLVGDLSTGYWTNVISNAKSRDLEFNITPEYVWDLFINQEEKCALSGISLNLKTIYEITASLDRIDSSQGYIKGNVQWVHKQINQMKNNLSDNYFIDICIMVANNALKN